MRFINIEISIHNLEEAVDKVGTASGEIVDIIKLIGDIAEETNLLSLNASIEAARAGEAGRGFAVVASQIGVLAKNSADSVAHITSLINEINGLVDDAVKQGRSSASDIESSADLIHTAVDTFDQISRISRNQPSDRGCGRKNQPGGSGGNQCCRNFRRTGGKFG